MRQLQRLLQWQHWPFFIFHTPLVFAWLRNYLRSRSLWYFTAANPKLTFGGFEGESKSEQYALLPPHLYPRTVIVNPGENIEDVKERIAAAALEYPFVVKPDVGMKGILFRKIYQSGQLEAYHRQMPATYLVQEFVQLPLEVSVFYCRMPDAEKGVITAFIQKDLLQVKGDGRSTLSQLVRRDPEANCFYPEASRQLGKQMEQVLPEGKPFVLSHVANLMNGARFINLRHLIDERLCGVFDAISHQCHFYYGRYDIKCTAPTDLHTGKGFHILEFNGAGSVPNHIYTGTYTLLQAYAEIIKHWNWLFAISDAHRKKGFRYPGTVEGQMFLQGSKKHFNRLKALDRELVL